MVAACAFIFVFGLLIGSFVTALAFRIPRGMSIMGPRSMCPGCGERVAAYDNIPVVSWVLLRGRARCCGIRVSPRYPLTELTVGVLFLATALVYRDDAAELAIGLVFITTLATITLTDLEKRIIPNRILLPAAVICLAIAIATDPGGVPERIIAGAAAGGLLFVAALAYPAGMGLGDVKLAAVMGLFLGRNVAPAILIALLTGSIVGVAMIVREGASARKTAIPFGPFLAVGGVVGLLAGNELVDAYLNLF